MLSSEVIKLSFCVESTCVEFNGTELKSEEKITISVQN